MTNEIGNVKGIHGTSVALNNQKATHAAGRPDASAGKSNPGDCKPPRMDSGGKVPMPTK